MDRPSKKRCLPAFLSTARPKETLVCQTGVPAGSDQSTADTDRKPRCLPAWLEAPSDSRQQFIPELTLSSVRAPRHGLPRPDGSCFCCCQPAQLYIAFACSLADLDCQHPRGVMTVPGHLHLAAVRGRRMVPAAACSGAVYSGAGHRMARHLQSRCDRSFVCLMCIQQHE